MNKEKDGGKRILRVGDRMKHSELRRRARKQDNTLYGHGIKNPHILHALQLVESFGGKHGVIYLCGNGGSITPQKIAPTVELVRCKNCRREMRKIGYK